MQEPLHRPARGRLVAGVCAGLAARLGIPVAAVRLAALALTLVGGIGVLAYLAGWIVLPSVQDEEPGRSALASLALVGATAAALATLAAVAGVATVFGFGLVVAAVAGAALAVVLLLWPRLSPAWALLPVASLVVPAVAMAAGGVRVAAQVGDVAVAPRTAGEIPPGGYASGLGMLLVDLRRTSLPDSGTVRMRIDAGVRRTIVALPHDRCVVARVRMERHPLARQVAVAVARGWGFDAAALTLFGEPTWGSAITRTGARARGPVLELDVTSAGGPVVVRDWPDDVDPSAQVDWPGYAVVPEERPSTSHATRREARRLVRAWRARRAEQERSRRRIDRLIGGPCAREASR